MPTLETKTSLLAILKNGGVLRYGNFVLRRDTSDPAWLLLEQDDTLRVYTCNGDGIKQALADAQNTNDSILSQVNRLRASNVMDFVK